MPLHIYNTLTRRTEPLKAHDPSRVTFYSCGPTVYDDAHIGNFRSFLAADLLRRFIESELCELQSRDGSVHRGPRRVVHVMNITDVGHMTDDAEGGEHGEDRMAVAGRRIAEAKKAGKLPAGVEINPGDPFEIAKFYTQRFVEDAERLGLKLVLEAKRDPTLMPRATANVPGMIAVIRRLLRQGNAYTAGAPGQRAVYFRVKSYPAYGVLSGNTLDALREGEGGRVSQENQQQKEHPADFLLWKEDARHVMSWAADYREDAKVAWKPGMAAIADEPWGKGYPGWHIECTIMSVARLRGTERGPLSPDDLQSLVISDSEALIDVHSGGEDNIFPHHECENAQSCCAFHLGASPSGFSSMWFHPRFLLVEGTKMSKSKGNFFTARDLFAKGHTPGAIRLELIRTHYRSNADFREQGLKDSERQMERWRRVLEEGAKAGPGGDGAGSAAREAARTAFASAMHDDLNIAGTIAAINTWVGGLANPSSADAALMKVFDGVLGVLERERAGSASVEIGVFIGVEPDPKVVTLLEQRRDARTAKDFKRSDQIRDELAGLGYAIKDVAGGKVEVRRA